MFANLKKQPFIKMAALSTLVAEDVEITGNVVFTGGMRIDGLVKGDVIGREVDGKGASLLVLSDKGRIEGSIRCSDAVINGIVTGDLDIEQRLELQSDARVRGTIRYKQLQMDVGASVSGHLVKAEDGVAAGNVVELGQSRQQ
ncbi:MAG TPA: polymer-forming cytoskeletal protein [Caldimonas sp.]|jgi:cytoskeletal protein CcmA (bactofilin family)|nr:polymer-forming cytoskeletal protein [Caldimonas sp.]HEX2541301.1 polymer-forming cytoskeletal protein [Caldimonas sp.]